MFIEIGIIGADPDQDPDPDLQKLRRNGADPEAGSEKGIGIRDVIGNAGAVLEREIERGVIEENVPTETGIARENGKDFQKRGKEFQYPKLRFLVSFSFRFVKKYIQDAFNNSIVAMK